METHEYILYMVSHLSKDSYMILKYHYMHIYIYIYTFIHTFYINEN